MDGRVKPGHDGVLCGPGSAAHHAVKNGVLRCVRGTQKPERGGGYSFTAPVSDDT